MYNCLCKCLFIQTFICKHLRVWTIVCKNVYEYELVWVQTKMFSALRVRIRSSVQLVLSSDLADLCSRAFIHRSISQRKWSYGMWTALPHTLTTCFTHDLINEIPVLIECLHFYSFLRFYNNNEDINMNYTSGMMQWSRNTFNKSKLF